MNRIQAINLIDGLGDNPEIQARIERFILEAYRQHGLNILRDDALSGIATKLQRETDPIEQLIVDYIGRGPASLLNVASHFGMDTTSAQTTLLRLAADGRIQPAVGMSKVSWKAIDAR